MCFVMISGEMKINYFPLICLILEEKFDSDFLLTQPPGIDQNPNDPSVDL